MSIDSWVKKRFPESRKITDDTELKKTLLDILVAFDTFCRHHDIPYYLASGTCLGAVRHGGFIPWDDDIDVRIPRPHYRRFLDLSSSPIEGRYQVLSMETSRTHIYPFAKLVDTRTICIEQRIRKNYDYGLWVDIFPVDGCADPDGKEFRANRRRIKKLRGYLGWASTAVYASDSWIKTIPRLIGVLVCKLIGPSFFLRKIVSLAERYDYDSCDFVSLAVWGYGERECTRKEIVSDFIETSFEGHSFFIPKRSDEYLSRMYGDYMTPPPESDRVYRHSLSAYWKKGGES